MLVKVIWRGITRRGDPTTFETVGFLVDRYRASDGVIPPFILVGATKDRDGEITTREVIAKSSIISTTYLEPIAASA